MEFRKYSVEDETEVKNIFRQYWTDADFLEELASELDSDNCRFYILEDHGEIIGIAGLRPAPEYIGKHAETKNPVELYIIASKYKNKGIGSFLARRVFEEARRLQYSEILCYSPETHNSSWKFYESLEFEQGGIIQDPDDGYPGMLWKRPL